MNKILFVFAIALFCVVFASAKSQFDASTLMDFLPKNITNRYCPTEDIWRWKKSQIAAKRTNAADCVIEGLCDIYNVRNLWIKRQITIKLVFNIVCPSVGNCPVTAKQILDQFNQINNDFKGTGVTFEIQETNEYYNSRLAVIAAYGNNPQWYYDILEVKELTNVRPKEFLNIFVTRQRNGASGTLLGIGTFPWDPEAPTAYGGLWVNADYFGDGETTLAHEAGHNVGLWHTFHGTAEVSCNNACYEVVHNETDDTSFPNQVGDFCADTLSQPVNYLCSNPTSSDCRGTRYTDIDRSLYPLLTNNVMSYAPDSCVNQFTNQQAMRAHCWICDRLPEYPSSGQCDL